MVQYATAVLPGQGNAPFIKPTNAKHKKIIAGNSFTVPEAYDTQSPSGSHGSQGVSGGVMYAAWTDDPGVEEGGVVPVMLQPGDIIAVAIASNVMTVTINSREVPGWRVTGTALTAGGVQLYYA